MAMIEAYVDAPGAAAEDLAPAAALFRSFADPNRLAILQHLALGEHRVTDLTAHLGLAQSTVSQHLACLRDCGLVTSRPEGRASVFSLNHAATLESLWEAAETLLAATGARVALCPAYGLGPGTDRGDAIRPDAIEESAIEEPA